MDVCSFLHQQLHIVLAAALDGDVQGCLTCDTTARQPPLCPVPSPESQTFQLPEPSRCPPWPGGASSGPTPPTSVVDVPEGRVDELPHVSRLLGDVQEDGDGVVLAPAQVQQGLGQASLSRGGLCEWKVLRGGQGKPPQAPWLPMPELCIPIPAGIPGSPVVTAQPWHQGKEHPGPHLGTPRP